MLGNGRDWSFIKIMHRNIISSLSLSTTFVKSFGIADCVKFSKTVKVESVFTAFNSITHTPHTVCLTGQCLN